MQIFLLTCKVGMIYERSIYFKNVLNIQELALSFSKMYL